MFVELALGLLGPTALSSAILLSDFATRGVPFLVLSRSLFAVWILTTACYLVLLLVLRRPAIAASGTTLFAVAVWTAATALCLAVLAVLLWRVLCVLRREPVAWSWDVVARVARTVSLALLVVVTLGALPGIPTFTPEPAQATKDPGPPIYVVLLDAYPRADALAASGFDNEAFLKALEDRQFDVARSSTANYDRTQHSLTSLLYMRHLDEMDELRQPPDDIFGRLRLLTRMIAKGGEAFRFLREHGYRVMTIPSPVVDVTTWGADVVDVGHLTDFEIHLINDTDAGRLLTMLAGTGWLADEARRGVQAQLDALVAAQGPGRFIWVHLMVPHRPYVFGPNGGIPDCFPSCRYWTAEDGATQQLIDQVVAVNALTLAAVDRISRDALVVLISDHGSNLPGDYDTFGNLIAVRTPGGEEILPEDTTLVTVFPRIFNAYLGGQVELPEDRHYDGGPPGRRLELTRVD
jgi:hypothetical protein